MTFLRSLWNVWTDALLGPVCPHCEQRQVGHRHLDAHTWFQHGDES